MFVNFVCDSEYRKREFIREVGNSSLSLSFSLWLKGLYNIDSLISKWHVLLVSEGNVKKEFIIASALSKTVR